MMPVLIAAGWAIALAVVAWWWLLRSTPPELPQLGGILSTAKFFTVGEDKAHGVAAERSYLRYVPTDCPRGAPLLLVLHGPHGSAAQIRRYTGYEFERLAEAHKFIVAYPEGFGGYWNDVRRKGGYAAKQQDVDDVGFLRALVKSYRQLDGVGKVFAVGYSNGAQMCFRLALDAPGMLDAMAVFGACMPTPDNSVSAPLDRPLSMMIVNGTDDPINPYGGGHVTIFGFGDRGTVLSTVQTAEYFAAQLGDNVRADGPIEIVAPAAGQNTSVELRSWRAWPRGEVLLYTVQRGGHVVPQPHYRFFRLAGRTEMRFNAPDACWAFFSPDT